jgi:uncharacterized lipoprotein YehR (DUF1307 family)
MGVGGSRDMLPFHRWLALCFLLFFCNACSPILPPGSYQGDFSIQGFSDHTLSNLKNQPIIVQITYPLRDHAKLFLQRYQDQKLLFNPIDIQLISKGQIRIKFPDLNLNQILITGGSQYGIRCYEGKDHYLVSFCLENEKFSLHIGDRIKSTSQINIFGAQSFLEKKQIDYEPFQELSIQKAVQLRLLKNLDIQSEIEIFRQARLAASSAYLALLPHLSINSITAIGLGAALQDPTQVTGAIGDFVPFIFPTRWTEARKSYWQRRSADTALMTLKLNTTNSIHVIAISYLMHTELREQLKLLMHEIKKLIPVAQQYESSRLITEGSKDTLQTGYDDVKIQLLQLDEQIQREITGLAQVLGYTNPEAIKIIDIDNDRLKFSDLEILKDEKLTREKHYYADLAVNRSFELLQQSYLMNAAKLRESELYLNWLDPAGNSSLNLGFNLIPEYKITHSILDNIHIKMKAIRQTIISNAFNTVHDRNQMLKLHRLSKTSIETRIERFKRMSGYLIDATGNRQSEFNGNDFKDMIQDITYCLWSYFNSKAAFQMDQVTLERLSLIGPYFGDLFQKQDEDSFVKSKK